MRAKLAAKVAAVKTRVLNGRMWLNELLDAPASLADLRNEMVGLVDELKDMERGVREELEDIPNESAIDRRIEDAMEEAFSDRNFNRAVRDVMEEELPDAIREIVDSDHIGEVIGEVDLTEHETISALDDRIDDLEAENEGLKKAVSVLTAITMRLAANADWDVDDPDMKALAKLTEDN